MSLKVFHHYLLVSVTHFLFSSHQHFTTTKLQFWLGAYESKVNYAFWYNSGNNCNNISNIFTFLLNFFSAGLESIEIEKRLKSSKQTNFWCMNEWITAEQNPPYPSQTGGILESWLSASALAPPYLTILCKSNTWQSVFQVLWFVWLRYFLAVFFFELSTGRM